MMAAPQRFRAWLDHKRWLLRYWVLDKHFERLRLLALQLANLVIVADVAVAIYFLLQPAPATPTEIVRGVVQWVVQLIILIVSALIQYALRPKPEEIKPGEAKAPVVEDGRDIDKIYGEVWTEDPLLVGAKEMGTQKIKSKGGKK